MTGHNFYLTYPTEAVLARSHKFFILFTLCCVKHLCTENVPTSECGHHANGKILRLQRACPGFSANQTYP